MLNFTLDLKNYNSSSGSVVCRRTAARAVVTRKNSAGETEVLMIHGKYGDYKFPGGGVENGESVKKALHREVREEAGYKLKAFSLKLFAKVREIRAGNADDIMDMQNYYFFCCIKGAQLPQILDDYEKEYEYKTIWITAREALAANEAVSDLENVPWVKRESLILHELIKHKLPVL